MIHATNPHNPPAPSGYTAADFHVGDSVWVALEQEPCTITGTENWGDKIVFATRAADGVDLSPVTADLLSPAEGSLR